METITVTGQDAIELIGRAKKGDRSAFDQLFSNTQDQVVKFVRSRLGPSLGQRVDPEDVLQDTLVRAYVSIAQFEWNGEDSFVRWLEGIAGHCIADVARSLGRKKELQIVRNPTAKVVSPSRDLRRKERFGRLRKCIVGLSPDYQRVIVLARLDGLTTREIAARMERSESAVKSLLFRAMKELKNSFGDTESLHLGPRTLGKGDAHDGT